MADKAISELTAAEQIKSTDMFVLEQDGAAKRLQGQVLLNWLTAAADGHGGISDISKTGTSGLVDTYTITLADTTTKTFTVTNGNGLTKLEKLSAAGLVDTYRFTRTDGTYFKFTVTNGNGLTKFEKLSTEGLVDTYRFTRTDGTYFDFTVTNGNGLTKFEKLSTVGLVDTYRFTRTDGTYFTFAVTNGAKGDKGDNSYIWIKYASQQPTASSHDMGDDPDDWMGIYSGTAAAAPDDWQAYAWFQIKGEKGDTGAPASVESTAVEYMVSDSGTIVPSGSWSTVIPVVPQGKYLWTRVTTSFNTGNPAVSYSVARMGLDGTGSVVSVNTQSPDENGNVSLTASQISTDGGNSVQDELDSKQEALTPGANISISGNVISTQAAPCNPNLLDGWYFPRPVNQRGQTAYVGQGYGIDRWFTTGATLTVTLTADGIKLTKNAASANPGWVQALEYDDMVGQTVTVSMLYKGQGAGSALRFGSAISARINLADVGDWTLAQATFTAGKWTIGAMENRVIVGVQMFETVPTSAALYIKAAKLELGSVQTLAHQDSNGAWVLNEIPDYAEQLRKCQRYLYVQSGTMITFGVITGGKKTLNLAVPVPVPMRSKPTLVGVPDVTNVRTIQGTNMAAEITGGGVVSSTSLDTTIAISVTTETFNTNDYVNNTPIVCYISGVELNAEL